jgi:hypothetical protein
VLLWDSKTWKPTKSFPDQALQVTSLAFSPDGNTLAIGAGNGARLGAGTEQGRIDTPGEFRLWKLK